ISKKTQKSIELPKSQKTRISMGPPGTQFDTKLHILTQDFKFLPQKCTTKNISTIKENSSKNHKKIHKKTIESKKKKKNQKKKNKNKKKIHKIIKKYKKHRIHSKKHVETLFQTKKTLKTTKITTNPRKSSKLHKTKKSSIPNTLQLPIAHNSYIQTKKTNSYKTHKNTYFHQQC